MAALLQPAIVGATGYAGLELLRLLLRHPRVKRPVLFTREKEESSGPQAGIEEVFPHLMGPQPAGPHLTGEDGGRLVPFTWEALRDQGVDLLFLATPHEISRAWVPEAL